MWQLFSVLVQLFAVHCYAQGPMDGMSKITLAAETDPLGAMAFTQKYFGATPDHDSCAANVCLCAKGDSSSSTPWQAVLGRADIVRKGFPAGRCVLRTAVGPASPAASDVIAVTPSGKAGVDCTYNNSYQLPAAAGNTGYTVNAHDADTCCKSCAALATCVGATYIPNPNAPNITPPAGGPPKYEGFGLHLPAIAGHVTTGGITVREVEAITSRKLAAMRYFDAWLDFNVALYTRDFDNYIKRFLAEGVPFLGSTWNTSDGRRMFSAFVLVPSSTLVIELIGARSTILDARMSELVNLEQRLSTTRMEALDEKPPPKGLLLPVRVSRAASNLTALDEFYLGSMRLNSTLLYQAASVQSRCYLWPGGNVDICFVQRPENATTSELKVRDFELMLKRVADTVLTKPTCNMNRWADNHYAVDLLDQEGAFDYIVDYVDSTPSARYQCGDFGIEGLHYIYDPTGWAVQLNMKFTKQPKACISRQLHGASFVPNGNPMCGGGTCASNHFVI